MKKKLQILSASLVMLISQFCLAQESNKGKLEIQPDIGFHYTNLKWSIAGNEQGKNPNVMSELKWKKLKGIRIQTKTSYYLTEHLQISNNFSYAKITSGEANDADYISDDRQDMIYDENFLSNRGFDLSFESRIGYVLNITKCFSITPIVGFDFRRQQVFLFDPPGIENRGLNSRYKNNWKGATFGFDTHFKAHKLGLLVGLAGSISDYKAEAKWNLIAAFVQPLSFKQTSMAYALRSYITAEYPLNKSFKFMVNLSITYAKGAAGLDEAYYVNRNPVRTRFNGVESLSYGTGAGIAVTF